MRRYWLRTGLLDEFVGGGDRDVVLGKLARQVPVGRIVEIDDVVRAVLLAGDDSAMMAASELKLDGGLSAL